MWRGSELSKVDSVQGAACVCSLTPMPYCQIPKPLGRDAEEADVEKERIEQT